MKIDEQVVKVDLHSARDVCVVPGFVRVVEGSVRVRKGQDHLRSFDPGGAQFGGEGVGDLSHSD